MHDKSSVFLGSSTKTEETVTADELWLSFFFFLISENKTLLFPIFPLQCRSIHGLYEKQNFAAVIVCYTRHLSFAHLHDAEELSELNV